MNKIKIEFPERLMKLLEGSELNAPILDLAGRVCKILSDNKLTFFPYYTDHGIDHINCLLKSEVELIPEEVWENNEKKSQPRLLCDADAVVIIGGTLLHDIAMHLQQNGFLELVGKSSRFKPLHWFNEDQEGHTADRPWHELWDDYVREAKRFSDRDLTNIIGEESARVWKFDGLPEDKGQWEENHRLIIGEFIRRHHARLAHEIAIYGFPGLQPGSKDDQFPAIGEKGHALKNFADLIGLSARSHGISLRLCKEYLDSSQPGTPRPMGTAVIYPMALLRVADYLQIDKKRAPAVLLQFRNPQSPVSLQEWEKHIAVQQIVPANDPRGKMVTISNELSLSLYLQLRDLLAGLQIELDHSTAVLDETYGNLTKLGLDQLNLSIRRVHSNLQTPKFRENLLFVPERTGFSSDPNLLTLLVEPLYGKEPSVGVRELMQNSIDAVQELKVWCEKHNKPIQSLDLPKFDCDCDILIEFIKRDDGTWILRVQDKGIGMSSDTIQNYFLRAGASYRNSKEWSKEFVDETGKPSVIRAGRFGIGAFAVFLLGTSFRLFTRHAGSNKNMGYIIEASSNSQLIELRRADYLHIGTTVEIDLNNNAIEGLALEEDTSYSELDDKIDWFCLNWPNIIKRIIRKRKNEILKQKFSFPIRKLPPEWSTIYPNGFDAVYWTFSNAPALVCNGLKIKGPGRFSDYEDADFDWPDKIQLKQPNVIVLDSAANLPLTTQRYKLSRESIPFIDELAQDVTLSFIAHTLICGPANLAEYISLYPIYPLMIERKIFDPSDYFFTNGYLRLCATTVGMVPVDPWLYTLLKASSCLVYGVIDCNYTSHKLRYKVPELLKYTGLNGKVILPWNFLVYVDNDAPSERCDEFINGILTELADKGIQALGKTITVQGLSSISTTFNFEEGYANRHYWSKINKENASKHCTSNGKNYFEYKNISFKSQVSLTTVLNDIESALKKESFLKQQSERMVLFVSDIKAKGKNNPESLIAKIWNECLGKRAIPFDPVARKDLIADGCKHPELKRHIEAWQKMKKANSKYCDKNRMLNDDL